MGHRNAACRVWHGLALGLLCLPATGCLEPFSGSNVQFDFANGTQVAAARGATPAPEQPAADTYYALWAANYTYVDVDGNGLADLDMNGEPLVDQAFVYEVQRFEIKRLIDRNSPCFIDLEGAPFPGIHVTQHAAKMRLVKGVSNPLDPAVPRNDAIDVLTADRRVELLPRLENELKAVTSTSTFEYPATAAADNCGVTDQIPHPTCIDDAANAVRLRICTDLWKQAGPDFYEGSDKVFTLPLNGVFYGMVEGMNPINDGFVGGAGLYVDEELADADQFLINWQYKDLDNDGTPDDPGTVRTQGYAYMQGRSERNTRGVIDVSMFNANSTLIRAELAVFPNLGDDSVNF